jgi:hypothetical protein
MSRRTVPMFGSLSPGLSWAGVRLAVVGFFMAPLFYEGNVCVCEDVLEADDGHSAWDPDLIPVGRWPVVLLELTNSSSGFFPCGISAILHCGCPYMKHCCLAFLGPLPEAVVEF